MNILTQTEGLWMLGIFGLTMIAFVWFRSNKELHMDGFLVADRKVPMWQGAFSIAISWVWAPALFVCSMQAFKFGLPGLFWFTLPNVLCFFVFVPVAIKLRKTMPHGYTLPQFIYERFGGNKLTHLIFLLAMAFQMVTALIANSYAGGTLLNAVSGIEVKTAITAMMIIALTYSLLRGLKASVFTDVLQMFMVIGLSFIIVPWAIGASEGQDLISNGLAGIEGTHGNIFHPGVAFAMGIPMTITLITGPLADQMFIQRAFAVKEKDITKTFVYGGLLFALVPISLGLLGFMGVSLVNAGAITVDNPEMVGPLVIGELLPKVGLYAFAFMAFAGLCSTLDSALCALSSLGGVDVYKRYVSPDAKDKRVLKASRITMLIMAAIGLGISLMEPSMMLTFLIGGSITAALFFPIIFALFWKKLTAAAVFWSIGISLAVGIPWMLHATKAGDDFQVVLAAVSGVTIPLLICVVFGLLNKGKH